MQQEERERERERKGEFLSGQSVSGEGEGEGGVVIRDSGIGLQCKGFFRIGSCTTVGSETWREGSSYMMGLPINN